MVFITVAAPSTSISTVRLFEPSEKVIATKGVSFGRLLLSTESCSSDNLRIPLVNFSNKKQWIPKGIVLGTLVFVTSPIIETDTLHPGSNFDFDSVISSKLSPKDRAAVRALLERYSQCFATSNHDLGRSNLVQLIEDSRGK